MQNGRKSGNSSLIIAQSHQLVSNLILTLKARDLTQCDELEFSNLKIDTNSLERMK